MVCFIDLFKRFEYFRSKCFEYFVYLGSDEDSIPTLKELKSLLNEAAVNRYPTNSDIYERLQSIVTEASKCSRAAKDLLKQHETLRKQQQTNNSSQPEQSPTKRTLRSTAGRNANSGLRYENLNTKLTLEEISLFYEEIAELQCEIPEKYPLKELVSKCNSIASSIMSVMDLSKNESNELTLKSDDLELVLTDAQSIAVVDFGPQLDSFRHKYQEIHWLEECDKVINIEEDVKVGQQNLLELSNIKTLIENGMKLAVNTDTINSKLAELQQMLDEANKWIERAKSCLFTKSEDQNEQELNARKPPLDFLESLLSEAENSPNLKRLQLSPQIDRIRESVQKSRNWITRVNAIFGSDNQKYSQKASISNANVGEAPMIEMVEELVMSANGIECQLEHLPNLNSTISAARNWKERLNRTFCKKNSLYSLIQIITPRIQSHCNQSDNSFSSRAFYQYLKRLLSMTSAKERKNSATNANSGQNTKLQKSIFETQLNGNYSRTCIVALYKMFEEQELNNLKTIRNHNISKRKHLESKAYDFGSESSKQEMEQQKQQSMKFCICGKEANEWMIECQLCFDWFHDSCVQNYLSTNVRKKQQTQQSSASESLQPQQHFICILCSRGRRPKIETILSLLCSLQKLPIRILEGELLQCVAERAITWQDRVRSALSSHADLANGHSRALKLQNQPSYHLTQTNQLICSPVSVSESVPNARQSLANTSAHTLTNDIKAEELATEEATAEALLQLQRSQPNNSQTNSEHLESNNSLESHSQNTTVVSNESNISSEFSPKHKRKSPLVLRGM
jgi:histone demethylase JARID1